MWDPPGARDWTCVSWIGRSILCHWASREVHCIHHNANLLYKHPHTHPEIMCRQFSGHPVPPLSWHTKQTIIPGCFSGTLSMPSACCAPAHPRLLLEPPPSGPCAPRVTASALGTSNVYLSVHPPPSPSHHQGLCCIHSSKPSIQQVLTKCPLSEWLSLNHHNSSPWLVLLISLVQREKRHSCPPQPARVPMAEFPRLARPSQLHEDFINMPIHGSHFTPHQPVYPRVEPGICVLNNALR